MPSRARARVSCPGSLSRGLTHTPRVPRAPQAFGHGTKSNFTFIFDYVTSNPGEMPTLDEARAYFIELISRFEMTGLFLHATRPPTWDALGLTRPPVIPGR